jgi:nitrate reductase NapE component
MNEQTNERPATVTIIAVITLLSGFVNVLWGPTLALLSFGILAICMAPILIFQFILGITEIVYASKLLYTPPQPSRPSRKIAWCEIATVLGGNFFSLIAGILTLVFYEDPAVIAYFARINGQPAAAAPAAPVPSETPALPVEPSPELPAELPATEATEAPEKKTRRPRKIAGG